MLHIKDNISEEELRKINEALVKFDYFIQSETKAPTDKNIRIYENWIDCMYDIQHIIADEKDLNKNIDKDKETEEYEL